MLQEKQHFPVRGWTWEWDGTQKKIWEGAPLMFKGEADFQPFLSPLPAPSLQDTAEELCCHAKTSHEEPVGRMFSCCFQDKLLGAASASKHKANLWPETGGCRLNFWGRKQTQASIILIITKETEAPASWWNHACTHASSSYF